MKLLKRFSSPFKVTIYPPNIQLYIRERLKKELEKWDMEEYVDYANLAPGFTVVIKLSSPDIENYFQEAIEHVKLANSYWDRGEIDFSICNRSYERHHSGDMPQLQ